MNASEMWTKRGNAMDVKLEEGTRLIGHAAIAAFVAGLIVGNEESPGLFCAHCRQHLIEIAERTYTEAMK